ncbi:MAG: bifunctional phosphopantothenoylcysteine decarboxylase/phosphopantothenate--cysteine ligase CoaBC, partial [Candidatus Diapherotrites archaeon]|nr:bifunctional phosphopantothenoylcysteine decarboxylase/phosphopantothenate--cysteine ligase CoaBC [Candidatus Diapherotrites archaeon]
GKKILVCLTGSVAVIETPKLVRELRRRGAEVICAMSAESKTFIQPRLLEWASDNKVLEKLTGKAEHVKLAGRVKGKVDAVIIAPCTSNTISKIASGIDDTIVTTLASTALGTGIPLIMVPAMHYSLLANPLVGQNVQKLRKAGVIFVEPKFEEKKAKFPEIKTIAGTVEGLFTEKDLKGLRILVSAGPTIEEIDDIRFISNRSSGKIGIAIAEEAEKRGAKVTLIPGRTNLLPERRIKIIRSETGKEMFESVKKEIKNADVFFSAAAVSDFTVQKRNGKISSGKKLKLELIPAPKILSEAKKWNPKVFVVGFKAEAGSKKALLKAGKNLLKKANCDLVVANLLETFGSDYSENWIVGKNVKHLKKSSKKDIARRLLDEVVVVKNAI